MRYDIPFFPAILPPISVTNPLCTPLAICINSWSAAIPPDLIIDRSQNANWKELAIQQLKPFVEEFGFLNQEIGFLANVYVKSKGTIAKQFQRNMARLIHDVKDLIPELKGNCITSQLGCLEDINGSRYSCFKDKDELLINEKMKLILALNICTRSRG